MRAPEASYSPIYLVKSGHLVFAGCIIAECFVCSAIDLLYFNFYYQEAIFLLFPLGNIRASRALYLPL